LFDNKKKLMMKDKRYRSSPCLAGTQVALRAPSVPAKHGEERYAQGKKLKNPLDPPYILG